MAFVKEYSADESSNDDGNGKLSAPAVSEEERKLLREIEIDDEPTLIVWNDAGQVSRIHVFERRP
jgi:hypothetical protein